MTRGLLIPDFPSSSTSYFLSSYHEIIDDNINVLPIEKCSQSLISQLYKVMILTLATKYYNKVSLLKVEHHNHMNISTEDSLTPRPLNRTNKSSKCGLFGL